MKMSIENDVLEELRKVKDEIASSFENVRDFCQALIQEQNAAHPELRAGNMTAIPFA